MPFAKVGDARLFYTDEGSGDPPLLLVHGWTGESHDWCFQLPAFTARHRVVAYDHRGHGRSSVTEHGYDSRQLLADMVGMHGQLGLGPVVAIGHSLGGVLVSMLAAEHPDLVRAVVVVDPPYGFDEQAVAASQRLGATLRQLGSAAPITDRPGQSGPATPVWLETWHRRRVLGLPSHVVVETFFGMHEGAKEYVVRPAADEHLRRRACPVLAFHADPGKADWDASTFAHGYSEAIGWKGSGHVLHQERPTELNALVLDWVAGLPPAGAP